ncbi:hypothetical protein TGPRC2_231790 [Toxoplasma gondii TgCatPRC2]|uniref:FAM13A-like domain-containing protein n=1 Tax=Toxoplasma gondii TgCatPRC2 TaxID=1130821 RepID=A0A151H355_TOXGO|nr:hypothetical protein TGPRC2_231790 [Toxoplasma gondii TgCatPRC2]
MQISLACEQPSGAEDEETCFHRFSGATGTGAVAAVAALAAQQHQQNLLLLASDLQTAIRRWCPVSGSSSRDASTPSSALHAAGGTSPPGGARMRGLFARPNAKKDGKHGYLLRGCRIKKIPQRTVALPRHLYREEAAIEEDDELPVLSYLEGETLFAAEEEPSLHHVRTASASSARSRSAGTKGWGEWPLRPENEETLSNDEEAQSCCAENGAGTKAETDSDAYWETPESFLNSEARSRTRRCSASLADPADTQTSGADETERRDASQPQERMSSAESRSCEEASSPLISLRKHIHVFQTKFRRSASSSPRSVVSVERDVEVNGVDRHDRHEAAPSGDAPANSPVEQASRRSEDVSGSRDKRGDEEANGANEKASADRSATTDALTASSASCQEEHRRLNSDDTPVPSTTHSDLFGVDANGQERDAGQRQTPSGQVETKKDEKHLKPETRFAKSPVSAERVSPSSTVGLEGASQTAEEKERDSEPERKDESEDRGGRDEPDVLPQASDRLPSLSKHDKLQDLNPCSDAAESSSVHTTLKSVCALSPSNSSSMMEHTLVRDPVEAAVAAAAAAMSAAAEVVRQHASLDEVKAGEGSPSSFRDQADLHGFVHSWLTACFERLRDSAGQSRVQPHQSKIRGGESDMHVLVAFSKRRLKEELRAYDVAFEKRYGRQPERLEKEPLRPLYSHYQYLRRVLLRLEYQQREQTTARSVATTFALEENISAVTSEPVQPASGGRRDSKWQATASSRESVKSLSSQNSDELKSGDTVIAGDSHRKLASSPASRRSSIGLGRDTVSRTQTQSSSASQTSSEPSKLQTAMSSRSGGLHIVPEGKKAATDSSGRAPRVTQRVSQRTVVAVSPKRHGSGMIDAEVEGPTVQGKAAGNFRQARQHLTNSRVSVVSREKAAEPVLSEGDSRSAHAVSNVKEANGRGLRGEEAELRLDKQKLAAKWADSEHHVGRLVDTGGNVSHEAATTSVGRSGKEDVVGSRAVERRRQSGGEKFEESCREAVGTTAVATGISSSSDRLRQKGRPPGLAGNASGATPYGAEREVPSTSSMEKMAGNRRTNCVDRSPTRRVGEAGRSFSQIVRSENQDAVVGQIALGSGHSSAMVSNERRRSLRKESGEVAVGSVDEVEQRLLRLQHEKRQLRTKLLTYQANFISETGRHVRLYKDIAPIEREYRRYKDVKQEISRLLERQTSRLSTPSHTTLCQRGPDDDTIPSEVFDQTRHEFCV